MINYCIKTDKSLKTLLNKNIVHSVVSTRKTYLIMDPIYTQTAFEISKVVTKNYSTSFYSAVNLLDKSIRDDIFGIYGFVRLAEIGRAHV